MSRRKDAKAALLQSRQHELNTLVQAGRMDEAMESAQKWGLDVDAVLDAVGQEPGHPPPPPTFVLETANSVEAPPPAPAPTPSLWPEFWNNVKDAGEKELFLSSMHESVQPTAEAKAFWSRYQKKYGKAPSDYKSRSAYTAVLLAADAIVATARKKKAFTGPDLVQTLEGIRFQAPTGTVQFGAKKGEPNYHQWNPAMLIGQWQDRKQVIVFPTKIATGKIRK